MNKTYRVLFYSLDGSQKCPDAYRLSRSIPLRNAKKMLGIEKWTWGNVRLTHDGGTLLQHSKKHELGNHLVFAYHGYQMKGRKV